MDCSMPGFSVHHQLLQLAQTLVHRVGDAIQPSHPLSSPSAPAFNLSQHQGLFQWVRSSHQVAKGLELQLQHQFFQWIFRTSNEHSVQENKICCGFHHFPIYLPWSDGTGCHDLSVWMLFLASFFTLLFHFHQEALFCSSLLSAVWVVSSAYLRLFLQQSWFQLVSSSLVLHMMYFNIM